MIKENDKKEREREGEIPFHNYNCNYERKSLIYYGIYKSYKEFMTNG